ncbi:hypothetical protein PVNG_04724 [Plasmodium vivax North Korean]|uniref:VIR protein n=1 Tax=Plasmodium vivax North Korean TaxID=1035514 RepID=A0A0J9U3H2_PLAVI|nr:hypothetical protein PVNG_04724 [Plasmodium vivax North Korean]
MVRYCRKNKSYIQSSDLNKLIYRLNEEYKSCDEITVDYFKTGNEKNNEILKNIGCHLYWGYSYLTVFNEKKLTDLCMYLNLWLDKQKRIHVEVNSEITDEEWNYIEKLWKEIEAHEPISKCKRQQDVYDISQIQERMELMTYCINRDYIKHLCEPSIRSNTYVSRRCSDLSDFTDEYYKIFHDKNQCSHAAFVSKDYRYYISEDCDLNNMAKTFPKFDSESKKIIYNDKTREPIKICESTAEVGARHVGLDSGAVVLSRVPAVSTGDRAASTDDQAVSTDDQAASVVGETGFQDSLSYPIQLDSLLQTELTSPENKPSKPIYYAGLSVSGVFFTSMVLYKV